MNSVSGVNTGVRSKTTTPLAAFLPASMDACALYRQFIPHLNIHNSRFIFKPGKIDLSEFVESRVCIVQRQVSMNNYVALQHMKHYGMKLVYDLDDNIWSVPAYNPGARAFKESREGFGACAAICDVITVSTRGLQSAVKTALPHVKAEVVVVPNAMDFRLFRAPITSKDDRIIIGWAGSNTHSSDVQDCWSILPEVITANENVYLEVVGGATVPKELKGHPRVHNRPWVHTGEYPARLTTWGWDILLAPLEDNRFNRSKSGIKLLEAGAIGAAALASDVQPYNDFFCLAPEPFKSLGLCNSPAQWKEKLSRLIADKALRLEMATHVRRVAMEFYNIDQLKENWQKVFRDIV